MDDGHYGQEAQAHEYGPGPHLYAVRRHAAQQYRSVRQNQSWHSDWPSLDDPLAIRCQTLRAAQHRERRGCMGDVRWYSLCVSAYLRYAMDRKRVRTRPDPDLDNALWRASRVT